MPSLSTQRGSFSLVDSGNSPADTDFLLSWLRRWVVWHSPPSRGHRRGSSLALNLTRVREPGGQGAHFGLLALANCISVGIIIIITALLITSPSREVLLDQPWQSSILGLGGIGSALVVLPYLCGYLLPSSSFTEEYALLQLEAERLARGPDSPIGPVYRDVPGTKSFRSPVFLLFLALTFRAFVFEYRVKQRQCAMPGLEFVTPLVVAIWEMRHALLGHKIPTLADSTTITQSQIPGHYTGPVRTIGAAALVSLANVVSLNLSLYPKSSYVCPTALSVRQWAVLAQVASLVLDLCILQSVKSMVWSFKSSKSMSARTAPVIIGFITMNSAVAVLIAGLSTKMIPRIQEFLNGVDRGFLQYLAWTASLSFVLVIVSIRLLSYNRMLELTFFISSVLTCFNTLSSLGNRLSAVPPDTYASSITPLFLLSLGLILHWGSSSHFSSFAARLPGRFPRYFAYAMSLLALITVLAQFFSGNHVGVVLANHPIESLVRAAAHQHIEWKQQARSSTNLKQAVEDYRRRYSRHPPPGFGLWYKYAQERSSLVIDDFDSIHDNLLPFWAFSPADLRARTRQAVSDPWNEVAQVSVRSGVASISEVIPTHRWMIEGVIIMMNGFVEMLPDMDIAFNINDESRLAVPFNRLRQLHDMANSSGMAETTSSIWSSNRAESLSDSAKMADTTSPFMTSPFENYSFKKNFRQFGSVACPPESPSRQVHHWDSSVLCTSCSAPHSYQQFLSDWSLSASPCHQPDIANLHGFYLSPAAYKTTRDLYPVFSQSRVHGYSDILYPTAWNYNDKIKYDPSSDHPDSEYGEKENMLFWRGTSTEGFSDRGTWRGMLRQRLVHVINNATNSVPILLPYRRDLDQYAYQELTNKAFLNLPRMKESQFSTSVGFVSNMVRCNMGDCERQEAEFGLLPSADFQNHWRHRFLLDVDGAGFSGRFLPFLQSHSLPFKAALFREWYDSRIVAWKHFVPLDMRLHGLWSTVAYFAGGFGLSTNGGKDPGKMIAEEGREWAAKVLRKEDMEIYFFRLLLEWGRLTDDRRKELGFSP